MKDRRWVHYLVLAYVALSFYEPFWRLAVRGAMEGSAFQWGYAGMKGTGVSGDYWVVVLIAIAGIVLLFLGWRGAGRVCRWIVLVWIALLLLSSIAIVASDPGVKIVADTLNMEIPYALTVLPLDMLSFLLAVIWLASGRRRKQETMTMQWKRVNTALLVFAAALFVPEYIALNAGEQHGMYDRIGVALTFVQWVLLNLSFLPWTKSMFHSRRRTLHA